MQEYYCTLCLLEAATIHIKKLASSYSASGFSSVADQYNPRESSLHSSQSSVQPSTSVSSGDSKVTVLETATLPVLAHKASEDHKDFSSLALKKFRFLYENWQNTENSSNRDRDGNDINMIQHQLCLSDGNVE